MELTNRRVAITGYGCVSALGRGVRYFEEALLTGRRHLAPLEGVPIPRGKNLFANCDWPRSADRSSQMALAAAEEAIDMAGSSHCDAFDTGLIVGTIWGDMQAAEDLYPRLFEHKELDELHRQALAIYPTSSICNAIGTRLGVHGPRLVISNACASGNIALGFGLDLIRQGKCKRVIAVGVDRFSLTGLWGADRSGFLGTMLRPFDRDRDGTVLGEGAAAVVLEAEDGTTRKRARAWLEGFACVCEPGAAAITLREDGIGLKMAMTEALRDADVDPVEIEYVNAHAAGTPLIDLVECRAVAALWAESSTCPAVNATKSLTGHMSGASAVAEAIATVVQMEGEFLHGNLGLENLDARLPIQVLNSSVKHVPTTRAISNACGGGGLNTSVVIGARNTMPHRQGRASKVNRVVVTAMEFIRAPGRGNGDDELKWFDIGKWYAPESNVSLMNRSAQIAAATAAEAIHTARLQNGVSGLRMESVAVIGGTWLGGMPAGSVSLCDGLQRRPEGILPSVALDKAFYLAAMIVCREFGYTGPTYTICGSIAAGLQAFASAYSLLAGGRADIAIVMAYDSDDPWLRRMSAQMPECKTLTGFSEAAATVILETEQMAIRRNASILGMVHGIEMISGDLNTKAQCQKAATTLINRLRVQSVDRIALCGPTDGGMRALARILQQLMSSKLQNPFPIHSLAAEPLIALKQVRDTGRVLLLTGDSGGSQIALDFEFQ